MRMEDTQPHWTVITYHPDFETLKAEVGSLRAELSALVLDRDALLCHECKHIEMAYMLSIGALEYKVFELECAILRLKRKTEMIQAKKNRQERVDLLQIENALDREFEAYQARLDEQIKKMNAALKRSHDLPLTQEESQELKKRYHAIVKALHPDLHSDLSDAKKQLFRNAVEAYANGDLNRLRIIATMISEPDATTETLCGFEVLTEEKERLLGLIQNIRDEIDTIKSEFPYTLKPLLKSPEKTEARKAELEAHIQQLNEALAAYQAKVKEMQG